VKTHVTFKLTKKTHEELTRDTFNDVFMILVSLGAIEIAPNTFKDETDYLLDPINII